MRCSDIQTQRRFKKHDHSIQQLRDTIKRPNHRIQRMEEGSQRNTRGTENIVNIIVALIPQIKRKRHPSTRGILNPSTQNKKRTSP